MRCCIIVVFGLIVVACGTPPAQIPLSDARSEVDATPQDAIVDLTDVAAVDVPMDVPNEPLRNPQGPTATNTVPATLIATAMDNVASPGPVRFVDEEHGWMWNRSSIFTTTDGGRRWQETWSVPFVTLQYISYADFISMRQGWVAVTNSLSSTVSLFATQDSGATWNELPVELAYPEIGGIDFVDAEAGWVVVHTLDATTPTRLLHTTNGGKTWAQIVNPCPQRIPVNTHSINFINRDQGWIACTSRENPVQVYHSTDGGQSWQAVALPWQAQIVGTYAYISFQDQLHGWLQNGPELLETLDAGHTWQQRSIAPEGVALSIPQYVSPSTGYAGADGTLFRTDDAGVTWRRVAPPLRPSRSISLFDPQHGVGVTYISDKARVLHTDDGGRSWSIAGELTPECYEGQTLHFLDQMHGWSLGRAQNVSEAPPILCRTRDGGHTWTQLPDLHAAGAAAISFLDADTGYLGTTGSSWSMLTPLLQVTHDGGATFAPVSAEPVTAHQIEFLSPTMGWKLVDWQLAATTDGGVSWTPIPLGYRVNFFDLLPGGHAWVLAEDCSTNECERALLSTSDNGATWTSHAFEATWLTPPAPGQPDPIASPEPGYPPYATSVLQQISGITFVDPQHGWLVQGEYHLSNDQRRLWATMDGGHTWTMLP